MTIEIVVDGPAVVIKPTGIAVGEPFVAEWFTKYPGLFYGDGAPDFDALQAFGAIVGDAYFDKTNDDFYILKEVG